MTEGIAGKVVAITGANSGFGAAIALRLSKEGAIVVLAVRRPDHAQALAEELTTTTGGKALANETDAIDRYQIRRIVNTAL